MSRRRICNAMQVIEMEIVSAITKTYIHKHTHTHTITHFSNPIHLSNNILTLINVRITTTIQILAHVTLFYAQTLENVFVCVCACACKHKHCVDLC